MQIPLLVVVHLDHLRLLWSESRELVDCFVAARPWRVVVFIEQDDAATHHQRIEKFQTLLVGTVDVDVHVDEAEADVVRERAERFVKESFDEFDVCPMEAFDLFADGLERSGFVAVSTTILVDLTSESQIFLERVLLEPFERVETVDRFLDVMLAKVKSIATVLPPTNTPQSATSPRKALVRSISLHRMLILADPVGPRDCGTSDWGTFTPRVHPNHPGQRSIGVFLTSGGAVTLTTCFT